MKTSGYDGGMKTMPPKVLRGFRDSLPLAEGRRLALMSRLRTCFQQSGFLPIDTPALEYSALILGEAGAETEKQVYRFRDQGQRDVALRFDLTVPFARFIEQHRGDLAFPFKRYHMAKVWRGENTQRGRYREFYQCDFDIVGSSHVSADLDILLTAQQCLNVLAVEYRMAVNHRGILDQFFTKMDIEQTAQHQAMRILDKKGKLPSAQLAEQLVQLLGPSKGRQLTVLLQSPAVSLDEMDSLLGPCPALQQLRGMLDNAQELGLPLAFDPSIMRGLDYYTGLVFETSLCALPEIGSVCSGGRYDNLVSRYGGLRLAGVGGSVGLDRLLAGLEQLQLLPDREQNIDFFLTSAEEEHQLLTHRLAAFLRPHFSCDVYPGADGKPQPMGLRMRDAAARGSKIALIVQPDLIRPRWLAERRDLETLPYPRTEEQWGQITEHLRTLLQEAR